MKTYNGILIQSDCYTLPYWYNPETVLLFDIETTGFSPKNTTLYLLGMCFYTDNVWNYRLLFNDDGRSELMILTEFLNTLSQYHVLIHYNGDGFDLPYLKEKYLQYQSLTSDQYFTTAISELERLESVDLYKLIQPYRAGLPLPNLKLKTVEKALDIVRADTYTGGELIKVYKSYLKSKDLQSEQSLLQHNYDDILAMIPMLRLLAFRFLKNHDFNITVAKTTTSISISMSLPNPLPLIYKKETALGYICIEGCKGIVELPMIHDELRYYLSNWKDYYYLPLEDSVIHKSVAAFVDTEYRQKATKANAYLKHTADFFPCPKELQPRIDKIYKKDSSDSLHYAEWNPELPDNLDFWMEYIYSTFL